MQGIDWIYGIFQEGKIQVISLGMVSRDLVSSMHVEGEAIQEAQVVLTYP